MKSATLGDGVCFGGDPVGGNSSKFGLIHFVRLVIFSWFSSYLPYSNLAFIERQLHCKVPSVRAFEDSFIKNHCLKYRWLEPLIVMLMSDGSGICFDCQCDLTVKISFVGIERCLTRCNYRLC